MVSRRLDRESRPRPSRPDGGAAFPRALLERLAQYYQIATRAGEEGREVVSSAWLGELLGIDATLVRKDMAAAGISGRPKVGYSIKEVLARLDSVLGLAQRHDALLIGCGDLGSAIVRYPGFAKYGLKIAAVFDVDPAKIGKDVAGLTILPMEKCKSFIKIFQIRIAILTAPAASAQQLTDWLVAMGVTGIWNFSPVHVRVPPNVVVRNENLAVGLAQFIHQFNDARRYVPAP